MQFATCSPVAQFMRAGLFLLGLQVALNILQPATNLQFATSGVSNRFSFWKLELPELGGWRPAAVPFVPSEPKGTSNKFMFSDLLF